MTETKKEPKQELKPESKKEAYVAAAFKTIIKFRDFYGIDKGDTELLTKAAAYLFKRNVKVKNPSGKDVRIIVHNTRSHGGPSMYKVNPLGHDVLLQEYKNQKKIAAKKAKGDER